MKTSREVARVASGIAIATLVLAAAMAAPDFHPASLGWVFLSALLTAGALGGVAVSARGGGWPVALAISLLYFGVFHFNTLNEAVFFDFGLSLATIAILLAKGFLVAVVLGPLLVLTLGRMNPQPAESGPGGARRSVGGWLWRIALGDVSYIFLYFLAGMLVFPFVQDFYAAKTIPAVGDILKMQVFRGLVYIGVALPAVRLFEGNLRRGALALGLAFSVLGGIAPLVLPNPLIPANVRLAHGIEIGVSNFIYGVILARLLAPKPGVEAPAQLT